MIGKMNIRATFNTVNQTINGSGDVVNTLQTLHVCWAYVKPISSKVQMMQGAVNLRDMYTITIRYTQGINEAKQVVLSSHNDAMAIQGIETMIEGKKKYLKITVSATT